MIWFLSIGRLAWTSTGCTYVAEKLPAAKRTDGTLYKILWDTQLSFGFCVGFAQLKETPAHRTAASPWLTYDNAQLNQPHTYMYLLPCLSMWQVRRCVHIKNKLFPQVGNRDVEFRTLVHNSSSVVQLKPTKKYLQCLLVWLAFATAKSAIYRRSTSSSAGSPSPPQNVGNSGHATQDELTPSRKCSSPTWWRQTTTEFSFRMPKLKMKWEIISRKTAPGATEGRTFPLETHIETKLTSNCGINGVGGGGVREGYPELFRRGTCLFHCRRFISDTTKFRLNLCKNWAKAS